jgi:hypothetical protein
MGMLLKGDRPRAVRHLAVLISAGVALLVAAPAALAAPPPPVFTATDPPSPANNTQPKVKGTVTAGVVDVTIYKNSTCNSPAPVQAPASTFTGAGIPVNVGQNSTTTFFATARDTNGDFSTCSTSSITYVEQTPAPVFTATDPASPANNTQPKVKGTVGAGAHEVRIYKTSDCSGPAVASPDDVFTGAGIPVTVGQNSTTTFFATMQDTNGDVSPCSTSSITYTDQTPAPVLTATDPASPANNTQPRVKGTVGAGAAEVRIYKTPDCSGAAVVDDASAFTTVGIPVTVPQDSTTTFFATMQDTNGDLSPCSTSSITYVTRTPPPPPDTDPPSTFLRVRPQGHSGDRTPTFRFGSDEAGVTFRCRIDKAAFRRCAPKVTRTVGFGRHTMTVFARDAAGNRDPTAARDVFVVVRPRARLAPFGPLLSSRF